MLSKGLVVVSAFVFGGLSIPLQVSSATILPDVPAGRVLSFMRFNINYAPYPGFRVADQPSGIVASGCNVMHSL